MEKMTKVEYFAMVREIVAGVEGTEDLVQFIDHEVELIQAKAGKAKARAAQKKSEGDALREAVYAVITEDAQTIDDIVAQIEGEEITKAKVTARLTQLVNAGLVTKEAAKVDTRKVMTYKLVVAGEDIAE